MRAVLAAASIALMACGGRERVPAVESAKAAPASAQVSAVAGTSTGAKPPCPANGLWAACSIMDRLDHSGLAPRRDSAAVHEDGLTIPGIMVHLGNADLELFIYADSVNRRRDEARLDRKKFITADQEPTLAGERTIIESVNLLAILASRNDHQRERVSDAITAGPPQP